MTVHGAKGLEAPIVILPDTADRSPPDRDEIYRLPQGDAVWKTPEAESPALISDARQSRKDRRAEENLRLLYVALTRAKCWLIVAAAGKLNKPEAWYNLIRAGAEKVGVVPMDGGVFRHSFGQWPEERRGERTAAVPLALPDWVSRSAPVAPRGLPLIAPSDLGGAKHLTDDQFFSDGNAKTRGIALHLLLEQLPGIPAESWGGRAAALIGDPLLGAEVLAEVTGVLRDPDLAPLFAVDTLAEVSVTGDWNGHRLLGTIDRLVIGPDKVLIVDYKSNTLVPGAPENVPEGILRQLGAYAHIMGQIYPSRQIETAILWTRIPRLMRVDRDIVRLALGRAAIP